MFLGSLWLGPRSLPWFIVFVCACFCVLLIDQPTVSLRAVGRAVVTFTIALLIMAYWETTLFLASARRRDGKPGIEKREMTAAAEHRDR